MSHIVLALLFTGCADPTKDKVDATVSDPVPTEAPAPKATGVAYAIDLSQSELKAIGAKVTAEHPIVFHQYSGTVTVDGGEVTAIAYTAQVASLESDSERLTAHLKNEDFLHVDQYPTSTFESTGVTAGGEGGTHTVTGDLTIRGKTKRITFPATIAVDGDTVTAETEFAINRQDFEVTYPGRPDNLVQDKVLMQIRFKAKKG